MIVNLVGINSNEDPDFSLSKKTLVFKNPVELLIIIILVIYSLFVLNGYFLNVFNFELNTSNMELYLAMEITLFAFFLKRVKLIFDFDIKSTIFCIIVYSIVFSYSVHISPDLLPISGSVDAVHHYVLIDYLYNHESLPNLNYAYYMGEMVQYPFGASLATAYISKIFNIESIKAMQLLIFIVVGLIAVLAYLIAIEILEEYNISDNYKLIISLTSPFILLSVPTYFIGQYLQGFYYSMVFGEFLVMGTLLTLIKIEKGEIFWVNIFWILNIGIIFTYTLFILVPLLAAVVWLLVNTEIRKLLNFKKFVMSVILLIGLFTIYSYKNFNIGKSILQWEGVTVIPNSQNFNIFFLILVSLGILCVLRSPKGTKRIAFIYMLILFLELFLFIFLDQYGLIAKYFAYKTLYLQVLILSIFAGIPIAYFFRLFGNINWRPKIIVYVIILIIIFNSTSILINYPISTQPVITMEDLRIAKYAANYRFENNLTDENITIIAPKIKSYWLANGFLHMNRTYAINEYLLNEKKHTFNYWLNNKNSSYLIVAIEDITYDPNVEKNIFIKTEHEEGNMLFLRKI